MKFFLITSTRPTNQGVIESLLSAARSRGIETVRINSDSQILADMDFYESSSDDILYREALGEKARAVEAGLLYRKTESRPSSIYRPSDRIDLSFPWSAIIRYGQFDIATIPTIFLDEVFVSQEDDEIERRVQSIGGFPVILKRAGLSHGAGVYRVDSIQEFRNMIDRIEKHDVQKHILRRYLKAYRHARLIVLDGRVIDSIEYKIPDTDFRTNTGDISVTPQKFEDNVEQIAIAAVQSLMSVFSGVDILIDTTTDTPYIAECNSPCNFWRNQENTKVPIADMVIEYLVNSRN